MNSTIFSVFISMIITSCACLGQPNITPERADSLWSVWTDKTLPDSSRLNALDLYAWEGYLFSKPDSAFYYANLQFEYADSIGDLDHMARSSNTKGISYAIRGDINTAIAHYEEALEYNRVAENEYGIAVSLGNIGSANLNLGNYEKSIEYLSNSLDILRGTDYESRIAKTLGNLGSAYRKMGYYTKAMDYQHRSLNKFRSLGDVMAESNALNNIGNLFFLKGNYAKAAEYFEQSLELMRELKGRARIGGTLINLGVIYKYQKNFDESLKYFQEALKISEEIGAKRQTALALNNIGGVYYNQKEYHKAIEYHLKCKAIHEEIGDQAGLANVFHALGTCYSNLNNYPRAFDYHRKSMSIYESIGDIRGTAANLINFGTLNYKTGNLDSAIIYGTRAFRMADSVGLKMQTIESARLLFSSYWDSNLIDKADKFMGEVLKVRQKEINMNLPVLSEKEKELYFNSIREDFELFYQFAVEEKDKLPHLSEIAYNNALLTKGLLLKSTTSIRNAVLNSEDSVLIQNYHDWLALKRRIVQTYSQGGDIKPLEERALKIEKLLAKSVRSFSNNVSHEYSWYNIKENLNKKEVAIEFIRYKTADSSGENVYAALILSSEFNSPQIIKLFRESELSSIIGTFPGNNLSYVQQLYGTSENPNTQLYDLIWKPLEKHLSKKGEIYISPSGLLHKISFAALLKEPNVYLYDRHLIETLSSTAQIINTSTSNINKRSTASLFGGIHYSTDSSDNVIWKYLAGTLEETKEINQILRTDNRQVNYYTSHTASEEQFKQIANTSTILHIATHGFFYADPDKVRENQNVVIEEDLAFRGSGSASKVKSFTNSENPLMRSGLAFAGANNLWRNIESGKSEDGILMAQEVVTLDMRNTELVVLSACETGLGDIRGSEGVYGLQRSFKMAGVNYMIMSLWQVPDKETAEFMTVFYKFLVKSNDIKKSFHNAQQTMRKEYDPYYWAAFVLIE